jgi:hypothetical protein
MFLEVRRVSPKTAMDGKLEIAPRSAERIHLLSREPVLVVNGARGPTTITSMACTCGRAEGDHRHFFLESQLLRELVPESEVSIDLLEDADTVVVASRGHLDARS